MTTATVIRSYRELVAQGLAENRRHVVNVLRDPEPELRSVPIGDLLCWCDGLEDYDVARILVASEIAWGRRLSLLTNRDVEMVCLQIKARHPEVWERWAAAVHERRRA